MRGPYADATLERAIIQAFFAVPIKTNLNYDQAMQVMGASFGAKVREAKNPMTAMTIDHVTQAGAYHKAANHSFGGAVPMHLLPNEDIELHRSENADGNFEKFEKSVLRQIASFWVGLSLCCLRPAPARRSRRSRRIPPMSTILPREALCRTCGGTIWPNVKC